MIEEVFDYGRGSFGYRWAVVLDDSVKCLHRLQRMVRWAPFQQFNHCAANTPVWQQISDKEADGTAAQSHQISDAVVAPHCSITSGATGYTISQTGGALCRVG